MRVCLAIFFALAAASAALADDLDLPVHLTLEPQEEPAEPLHLQEGSGESFPEWLFARSELEVGAIYTDFDDDLQLDGGVGGFVRPGIGLTRNVHLTLAYRQSNFSSNRFPAGMTEDVVVQGLFAGVGYRSEILDRVELSLHGAAGGIRFNSDLAGVGHDTAPAFSGEAAVTVLVDGYLRIRAGLAVDAAHTDFHQTSESTVVNLTYLVGLEIRR